MPRRRPRRCAGHTEVDGEHLLLALLDQPDGLVPRLLGQLGADAGRCAPTSSPSSARQPALDPARAPQPGQVVGHPAAGHGCSTRPSGRPGGSKDEYVSVEHLLVALVEEGSASAAGRVLARARRHPRRVPRRR